MPASCAGANGSIIAGRHWAGLCIGTTGNGDVNRHRRFGAGPNPPTQAKQCHGTLRGTVALHNIQNRILAQPEPVADLPIGLAFADELEHLRCESVCFDALTRSAAEHDPALSRCGDPGTHPLAH